MPASAAAVARISSSLLADGSLNACASAWPATTAKITSMTTCTNAPTRELTPTAATPAAAGTPDFCRKRTFSAIPPTLAGETRLTNDEAACVRMVGQTGSQIGTLPISAAALAR